MIANADLFTLLKSIGSNSVQVLEIFTMNLDVEPFDEVVFLRLAKDENTVVDVVLSEMGTFELLPFKILD